MKSHSRQESTCVIRRFTRFAVLPCAALASGYALTGCAPVERIDLLEKRINTLALEQTSIRQEVHGAKTEEAGAVRSSMADMANKIDVLQAEIMRINGQIEKLAYSREKDRTRLEAVERQLTGTQPIPAPAPSGEEGAAIQPSAAFPQAPPPPPPEPNYYEKAMELHKEGDFKESKRFLQTYLDKNPKGDLADNAHFWIGENEFKLGRYEEAILAYQKLLDTFPNSNKAPDAMFKQGQAFLKLGDNVGAKIVFQKLVKKYPSSAPAELAKKELAKLK